MTLQAKVECPHPKNTLLFDACAILICLLSVYVLTYSGTLHVDDEHILAARAQSLAFWGNLTFPQIYGNERVRPLSTVPDQSAPPVVAIEPGQAVLGSFLYWLASRFNIGGAQAFLTQNIYATAFSGVLVYFIIQFLNFRRVTAVACAMLYGFGSMAWPYSKTGFRDPLAAFALLMAFLGWVLLYGNAWKSKVFGMVILCSGIVFGASVKSNMLVLLPAFLMGALVSGMRFQPMRRSRRTWLLLTLPVFILVAVAVCVPEQGPLSRFSLSHLIGLTQRYLRTLDFETIRATLGPFFSPTKSILLFNPLLFLFPFAIVPAWKRMSWFCVPALATVMLLALSQALHLRQEWAGTLFWGLRYMLPAIPLLTILIAPSIESFLFSNRPWLIAIFAGLILISLIIQLAGVIVDWSVPFLVWQSKSWDPYVTQAVWDPRFQVIPIHLYALLNPQYWDIAWVRNLASDPWALLIPFLALAGLVAGFGIFLSMRLRNSTGKIIVSIVLFLTVVMPFYPGLWILDQDPSAGGGREELNDLVSWAEEQALFGDIVVVDSYGLPLWHKMMNDWNIPVPWYSLPFEIPGMQGVGWEIGAEPAAATLQLFQEVGVSYARLIYLTSQEAPDYGLQREETWLKENLILLQEERFVGKVPAYGMVFAWKGYETHLP